MNLDRPRGLLLSSSEKERAARFCFEQDRVRWSRARSALRFLLARYLGTSALDFEFASGSYGKPSVVGHRLEFNLSHSGSWALMAISQFAPVGVDIERMRDNVDMPKLLRRIGEDVPDTPAPPAEELFHLWCRREARTKAAGMPLMQKPSEAIRSIDIHAPPGYAAALATIGAIPDPRYFGEV